MQQYQRIAALLAELPTNQKVEIRGWVRTRRDSKGFSFIEINDGSCVSNLQVIADENLPGYESEILRLTTGCSVRINGLLTASPAKGQKIELHAKAIKVYGWADPKTYPLQKKRHSLEFLREIGHLRPRTNSIGATARLRSRLSFAAHQFFQDRGFHCVHTPIITTSDCEGAGEMFTVTTLGPGNIPNKNGQPDFSRDFFGRQANLTVSGQLEAEIYCQALGDVYTFGPTFRAENSNTSRHLAEFWMIEPEMAFCDLDRNMQMAEAFVKHLINHALAKCPEEIALFDSFVSRGLTARLTGFLERDFARISYTEAIETLKKSGRAFTFPVEWGRDLQAEHERFLCEEMFEGPLIVRDYPKSIKPFYMRLNDDRQTVAAMDILVPGIGEIIGGSQREERLQVLCERMEETGLNFEEYQWYLDLRRYGTIPHAGFGLGFERLIQFVTGLNNIRDVIPFPRTPGLAQF